MTAPPLIEAQHLWTEEQHRAAERLLGDAAVSVDVVRLSFVDLHGVTRGKTISVAELSTAFRDGWGFPSSMLIKDTSHQTAFPVFGSDDSLVPDPDFLGIGDRLMIPDPLSFKVLPWANRTGWMLCDVVRTNGERSPLCTRSLHRDINAQLAERSMQLNVGIELECHIFGPADDAQAHVPPPLNPGYQYLTEQRFDDLEIILEPIRAALTDLDLQLRSVEVEFGPSQVEFTLSHSDAVTMADRTILLRNAIKQICRRHGFHATFMCKPKSPGAMASGWHLHQSLQHADGTNAFAPPNSASDDDTTTDKPATDTALRDTALSDTGRSYLAGLLKHGAATAALTNPTVNAYRRFRSNSLAPDRLAWGLDNRSAMLRVIAGANPSATRIENRVGEPAANPYLYFASQIVSGLAGIDQGLAPPPPQVSAYEADAARLPTTLGEAVAALEADATVRTALGTTLVDTFAHIKRHELDRFAAVVTEWEHREYFELF